MGLLSNEDKEYLKKQFKNFKNDVNIIFFHTEREPKYSLCEDTRKIFNEITGLSDKIKIKEINFDKNNNIAEKYNVKAAPAIVLLKNEMGNAKFYGVPNGYEFSSFVEDIIDIGMNEVDLDNEALNTIMKIKGELEINVFVTPTCPYCPEIVRIAHKFAMVNEKIKANMIDSYVYDNISAKYNITTVPAVVIKDEIVFSGSLSEGEFALKILEIYERQAK